MSPDPTLQSENHLAYFIADTLRQIDLRSLYQRYEGDGRRNRPYHPVMMLTLLVYAYATGVFSSRQIARKIDEDVAFRVLAGGNRPDFRTLNGFRGEHIEQFKKLFVEVVRLAKRMGLLKLGTVALDGTKVKANASKHKAMSYQRLGEEEERLEAEIQQLIERAEQIDAAEDEQYGDASGEEIPSELSRRESRVAKIREAKAALEAEQAEADRAQGRGPDDDRAAGGERTPGGRSKYKRKFGEPKPKAQCNFSDPESKIMKTGGGFEQCYNAQAVVEEGGQLIVAATVGSNAADNGYLVELVDEVKTNTGRKPRRVLADAGYKSEENFEQLEQRKIRGYVALGRESGRSANEGERGGDRADAQAAAGPTGTPAISTKKGAGGTGVRVGEAGVGISGIFDAGVSERARRMELGDSGVEPAADGANESVGASSVRRANRGRAGVRLRSEPPETGRPATSTGARCEPKKPNHRPHPRHEFSAGQTPSPLISTHAHERARGALPPGHCTV